MEHIVFISLFLGLVSGTQWVEMRADPEISAITVTHGGREVASLKAPPWHTAIDLGNRLEPSDLVATGFNDQGEVIASARQVLNLPRPVAELQIVLQKEKETTETIKLIWNHRGQARPKNTTILFDATRLKVTKDFSTTLPKFDSAHPHVVSAEMRFTDGAVARADLVLRGGFSDTVGIQLTPIALNRTSPQERTSLDGCFTSNGESVRASADEQTDALILIVKDPDPAEARRALIPTEQAPGRTTRGNAPRQDFVLDDMTARIIWAVAPKITKPGQASTKLFPQSTDHNFSQGGMRWLLTQSLTGPEAAAPRQFTDAVSVAGLTAMRSGRRRAVILLLSESKETSFYAPAVVRHYLDTIGVPVFVWSLTGPRPDLVDSWGPVDDISTHEDLRLAIEKLRETLKNQRIVWVSLDPLSALRVGVDPRCGLAPVARTNIE